MAFDECSFLYSLASGRYQKFVLKLKLFLGFGILRTVFRVSEIEFKTNIMKFRNVLNIFY